MSTLIVAYILIHLYCAGIVHGVAMSTDNPDRPPGKPISVLTATVFAPVVVVFLFLGIVQDGEN